MLALNNIALIKNLTTQWSKATKLLIVLGYICFGFSLVLTSFYTSAEDIQGYWVFLLGWLAFILFQFSWFANPISLLAILLLSDKPRVSFSLSVIALLLASQAFIFSEIPVGVNHEVLFINEFGLGFYLWYLAQVLFFLGIAVEAYLKTEKKSLPSFGLSNR